MVVATLNFSSKLDFGVVITFSDESSFGKESEIVTEDFVDAASLLIELDTASTGGALGETLLMVLVVPSPTSSISSDLTVLTISLYSFTIPFRFIIFSVVLVEDDAGDTEVCVVTVTGRLVLEVEVVEVSLFVSPGTTEIKGRLILRFLFLSLLSGRCGKSSSSLGFLVVVRPLW